MPFVLETLFSIAFITFALKHLVETVAIFSENKLIVEPSFHMTN